ncbi:MAG: DUF4317 domain-containing protein [Eubacteriales bacterium]|nr:DUF4317 domain-containing protein [Eubacteriales bacterium]MDD3880898.1 DUF4317 domain-containing protein [Eubacteriales bacterium]MDD4511735.1 DUF4317 domain-containing protein [Eubacteriales bacterium]
MNQKDIAEIKRRLNPEKNSLTALRGLYVNNRGEIISDFDYAPGSIPQEELEKYLSLMKRSLSGTIGQNLLSVDFSSEQAENGKEHGILMNMVRSGLTDDDALAEFFDEAIDYIKKAGGSGAQSVESEQEACNYLILMAHDNYDVPFRAADGENDAERASEVFSYILCCLCPVKQTKPALSYFAQRNEFHSRLSDWVVSAPEMGFMFPAFEDGGADIYRALFYTKDASDTRDDFTLRVFGSEMPMSALEQQETFQSIMLGALGTDCNIKTVQAVHETISEKIKERSADRSAEPLSLTGGDVRKVLEECGVSGEKAEEFEQRYTEEFGEKAEIPAVNTLSPKQFKIKTPSVTINVDPERSDLVETRIIDGRQYIMVLADGDVEVNGIKINW